jgi:hypothetical protein
MVTDGDTWEAETDGSLSSSTARATQRNRILKRKKRGGLVCEVNFNTPITHLHLLPEVIKQNVLPLKLSVFPTSALSPVFNTMFQYDEKFIIFNLSY